MTAWVRVSILRSRVSQAEQPLVSFHTTWARPQKRRAKQFFEHAGVGYGVIFSNSIGEDVVWLASWAIAAAEVEGVRWCGGTCTRSLVPVAHLVLGATGDCVCLPAVTDENPRLPASGFDRYK